MICANPTATPAVRTFAVAALLAFAAPALADYTRHCNGALTIAPQNESLTYLRYNFSVSKTVRFYAQVNEARRDARARMLACVRGHWANPDAPGLPDDCLGIRDYSLHGYPFENLREEVSAALCTANPAETTLLVSVTLTITGNTGCVSGGSSDRFDIARNLRIDCTAPIGDGGSSEASDAPPPVGDSGDWDCVGAGCDGTAEDEDGGGGLPATFHVVPMIRLPGNDLPGGRVALGSWQQCRDLCRDTAACGAFTYRTPAGQCLLKRGAGLPIPDACCVSGTKQ